MKAGMRRRGRFHLSYYVGAGGQPEGATIAQYYCTTSSFMYRVHNEGPSNIQVSFGGAASPWLLAPSNSIDLFIPPTAAFAGGGEAIPSVPLTVTVLEGGAAAGWFEGQAVP
jgi:hypothetical protein